MLYAILGIRCITENTMFAVLVFPSCVESVEVESDVRIVYVHLVTRAFVQCGVSSAFIFVLLNSHDLENYTQGWVKASMRGEVLSFFWAFRLAHKTEKNSSCC